MKAIFLVPAPDGGVYEYREVPKPTPQRDQVLVKVHAAGTNRGELLIAKPAARSSNPNAKASPAGIEFAGEIAEVGPDATGWHVGERVMGVAPGSYAEFVLSGSVQLMRIPDGLSWAQAASIPNVFVTAHDAVASNGGLEPEETIMVTAASSGIGTAAIQLARMIGARTIIATTRAAAKKEALTAVGADHVVDASQPGFVERVREIAQNGVDVVIDSVGGPMLADNIAALAVQGRLVSVGRNAGKLGQCDLDQVALKRASIIGVSFRTRTPQETFLCFERFSNACLGGFGSGVLKPVLDRTFPFDRLADAHDYMLSDRQVGKIVLTA